MKISIFPLIVKKIKQCLAINQDGATADRNIASGKYVCWKGDMYTANSAINSGDTLATGSGGNLTAVSDGVANNLNSEIATLNSKLTWQKAGGVQAPNTVSYPSTAKELYIEASWGTSSVASEYVMPMHILLAGMGTYYRTGYYRPDQNNTMTVTVDKTNHTVTCGTYSEGSAKSPYFEVYYR